MNIWRSAEGVLTVELVSAEPEKALTAINTVGISLRRVVRMGELTLRFQIRRADLRALQKLCGKRGEPLKIIRQGGVFFLFQRLRRRSLLILGLFAFLCMTFYLPTRVLFLRVEGNRAVPTNEILAAAQACGIHFGASRREIRSEKIKNELLDRIPQLQWAGINTSGCTAVISVRERTLAAPEYAHAPFSNMVASRDGYILSCVVTRGTGLVKPGQAVTAGQTLISGYTDCGICIQATGAEGEVFAQTRRSLDVITPENYLSRRIQTGTKRRISLLLGKKRIFFWKDSGISDTSCGRMYEEYRLTLPGGFSLPVAVCVDIYSCWETDEMEISRTDASDALELFARRYLKDQMIAGQIKSSVQKVTRNQGVYSLRGSYVCTEMIGMVKTEQIGDTNGKANGENRER